VIFTPTRYGIAEYCDERVCLCVCLSLRDHIFRTTCPIFTNFYRAMLCIRGTSHGPVSVRPSVCLTGLYVRPSQAGVPLKRQNVGSHKQHPTNLRDSSFLVPKISAKFDRGHPLRGAPNAGGVGQNRRLSTNNCLYRENGKR